MKELTLAADSGDVSRCFLFSDPKPLFPPILAVRHQPELGPSVRQAKDEVSADVEVAAALSLRVGAIGGAVAGAAEVAGSAGDLSRCGVDALASLAIGGPMALDEGDQVRGLASQSSTGHNHEVGTAASRRVVAFGHGGRPSDEVITGGFYSAALEPSKARRTPLAAREKCHRWALG